MLPKKSLILGLVVSVGSSVADGRPQVFGTASKTALEFYAITDEYLGLAYGESPRPPARLVIFRGEEIPINLRIANVDSIAHRLNRAGLAAGPLFNVDNIAQPAEAPLDRQPPVLRVTPRPERRDDDAIPAGETVRWSASLTPGANEPSGVYVARITPAFSGVDASIAAVSTLVHYELREITSLADRVEKQRRQAESALRQGNHARALTELDAMVKLYPTAYLAHLLRGEIAMNERRTGDALKAYQVAAQLLLDGRDLLMTRPDQRHEIAGELARKIEAIRRAR